MSMPAQYHTGQFPPKELDWKQLIPLLTPSASALARYDGTLQAVPNAALLLSPLTTQEAVLSSKIEGTQATMGEVLQYDAEGTEDEFEEEKRNDIEEIRNYRVALNKAIVALESRPLCQKIIKDAHGVLLSGVRGHFKSPGKYRDSQNYIGAMGTGIAEAKFIPIAPEQLQAGMDAWERYLHAEVEDVLVQLALVHAEFEALHPFHDGNGRIGRMIIPLFLKERGLLSLPMFYMSAYLERNREEYYTRLRNISAKGDWTGWCCFFLKGLKIQAEENNAKARAILELYSRHKDDIIKITRSQHAIHALDFLFQYPIFTGTQFVDNAKIPNSSASRILVLLRDNGWLTTLRKASGRTPARFAYTELVNVAEGRAVL